MLKSQPFCLLPNHFHLLLKINESLININDKEQTEKIVTEEVEVGVIVSEQFRRMFISFSQAINRQENRTGSLFTRNFKRILLEDNEHLKYLFFYIHHNPEKHGISEDYMKYGFSSYGSYLSNNKSFVSVSHGLELFDGIENFNDFHNYYHNEKDNLHLEQDGKDGIHYRQRRLGAIPQTGLSSWD